MSTNEFRVALTTDNFLQAVRFYSDGLGLDAGELWTGNGNGQVFWAGKAALEIFDPAYAAGVDQVEVGNQISGQIRFAFQVNDIHQALAKALKYGGVLINGPVLTPWKDLIVRIQSPEGLQITLFQEPQK